MARNQAAATSLSLAEDALWEGRVLLASEYFNDARKTISMTGESPKGWTRREIKRLGEAISRRRAK
jgi:hypothetical protein